MKDSILNFYRERYHIFYHDLADAGESNRIIANIISSLLFIFGLGDLIALILLHHSDLQGYTKHLTYFGIFMIPGILIFLYSKLTKNGPEEKSYIKKTIPVYIVIYMSLFISVFNFYVLGKPFNGVVTYFLTAFISSACFPSHL